MNEEFCKFPCTVALRKDRIGEIKKFVGIIRVRKFRERERGFQQ